MNKNNKRRGILLLVILILWMMPLSLSASGNEENTGDSWYFSFQEALCNWWKNFTNPALEEDDALKAPLTFQSLFDQKDWKVKPNEEKEEPKEEETPPSTEPVDPPVQEEQPQGEDKEEQAEEVEDHISARELEMLELVNQERRTYGLQELILDTELSKVADLKSQDMINEGYFAHESPTYGSPFDMMRMYNITYKSAAENLAGNSTVQGAHRGLMNSEGHRASILDPGYTHIGIGIVDGGPYGTMFTQMFIEK